MTFAYFLMIDCFFEKLENLVSHLTHSVYFVFDNNMKLIMATLNNAEIDDKNIDRWSPEEVEQLLSQNRENCSFEREG